MFSLCEATLPAVVEETAPLTHTHTRTHRHIHTRNFFTAHIHRTHKTTFTLTCIFGMHARFPFLHFHRHTDPAHTVHILYLVFISNKLRQIYHRLK